MFAGVELLKRVAKRDGRVYVSGGINRLLFYLAVIVHYLSCLKSIHFITIHAKTIVVWRLKLQFVGTSLTG